MKIAQVLSEGSAHHISSSLVLAWGCWAATCVLRLQAGESDVVETGIGRHMIDGKKQAVFPLDSRK